MIEQFVTYIIALKLKELGYNEKCLGYFNRKGELICGINVSDESFLFTNIGKAHNCCLSPLWQQVIDWLREKHNIFIEIENWNNCGFEIYIYSKIGRQQYYSKDGKAVIKLYSEARLQSILEAIKIIEEKLNN